MLKKAHILKELLREPKRIVITTHRGPIVAAILEKNNAVEDFRTLIGSTDPTEAAPGTIRAEYAESKAKNAVHGSDSDENAIIEADFHFSKEERF